MTGAPRGRTVPGALPVAPSGAPLAHLQELNSDMEVRTRAERPATGLDGPAR